MSVGANIKKRRKQLGINAETLAHKLGVSPTTIYRYENGGIEKVDSAKLVQIADALNTTPGFLMGWEESENEPSKQNNIEQALSSGKKADKWIMLTKWFGNMEMPEFDMWFNAISANHPETERNDDDDTNP